jgi:long-chain fatty acid transport protein
MKRVLLTILVLLFVLSFAGISSATNGDNLIAIGPISRAMGGVGIAAPQDAISAVFSNPAAMCFGPFCPGTEVNFGGTLFMPRIDARVTNAGQVTTADSDKKVFAIPAFGLSVPITSAMPLWRFGLAAYGVSGLGVDYRNTGLDNPSYFSLPSPPFPAGATAPLVAGEYTQLQIMKFSPSISFQPDNNFSVGIGVHIDYANLDLRNGSSFNYSVGGQAGLIYKLTDGVTFGATYVSPQSVKYKMVNDFDQDGTSDDLKLEQPQQAGVGLAIEPVKDVLLIEVDGKWINWASARGYSDFDWKNQWVGAIGIQFKPAPEIALRAGYNYGNNPVREHEDFAGTSFTTVQGKTMPTYYYETFRIVGFPALVKQHVTAGIGYEVSNKLAFNLGYMHAFKETLKESGTNLFGQPATLESTLREDSIEFGITWRF